MVKKLRIQPLHLFNYLGQCNIIEAIHDSISSKLLFPDT